MWAKQDKRNTLISTGDKILTREYAKRGKVSVDQSGSTLIIVVAQDQDAVKYKCSLTLRDAVQKVEHTVIIRGEKKIVFGAKVKHGYGYRGTIDPIQHSGQANPQPGG
jgi:hypothetical protein